LRIVQVFSAPPLKISLQQGPLNVAALDAEGSARAMLFGVMLRRFLGDGRPAAVAVKEEQDGAPAPMAAAKGRFMGPGAHGPWIGVGAAMHFEAQPGFSFVAQVRLRDGALVTFDSRQPAETTGWPYRLLLSLAVLLAAVVAVSLIAVRWTTRPLKSLADAADELGRNIDRAPMREQGPLEVARAARAFNRMQERLAGHVRERTATLAAMSHDLKTPVNRLRLRAELLEDSEVKKKMTHDLDEMQSMILGTLEFMRGGDTAEKPRPVDVNALLESLRADAQDTGAQVTIVGAASVPYVGRPQALKRCLGNLLDNALKYGNSAVMLVDDGPERLVMRIRDHGPGIPEAELERVFEPFYRLEGSRSRDTGGTGLGLSIARKIAQAHGGTLRLRNLKDGGLEAALALPR
jgi:signal transduction histidine kinase